MIQSSTCKKQINYDNKTLQELVIIYIEFKGYRKTIHQPSKNYIKFAKKDNIYWIGARGAVRSGQTVSTSESLSHYFTRDKLIKILKDKKKK